MSSKLYPGRCYLWMPVTVPWRAVQRKHCCEAMDTAIEIDCEKHADPWECADVPVIYNEIFDEYGLVSRDGSQSYVLLAHCPWCGTKLPESARERWIAAMDSMGLDTAGEVPAAFRTSSWRFS